MAGHAATSMAVNMERRKRLSMKSSLRYRFLLVIIGDYCITLADFSFHGVPRGAL